MVNKLETLNESVKNFNKSMCDIDKRIDVDWYLETDLNRRDDNYFARLKVLTFLHEDPDAKREYEKILEIKKMLTEQIPTIDLLDTDENGKIKLEKYGLSPMANMYVVSKVIHTRKIYKLFLLEEIDGKIDFKIRRLGIRTSEIVELLCDRKIENIMQLLLTEEIEEDGKKILAIEKLQLNKQQMKDILCSSFYTEPEIARNVIKGRYGDFGNETLALTVVNLDYRGFRELLSDEEIFEGKEELKKNLSDMYKNLRTLGNSKDITHALREIDIPEYMTVGVELESLGAASDYLYGKLKQSFQGKGDVTLKDGKMPSVEIISPILTNKNINDALEMVRTLTEIGQYTNETCGGHIHIGSKYLSVYKDNRIIDGLSTKLAWKSFLELWKINEETMYKICNGVGKEHRGVKFAKPLSWKINNMLEDPVFKLDDDFDYEKMAEMLKEKQFENEPIVTERNYSVNFDNLDNRKQTIEFRIANGTLDDKELGENIGLFTNFVDVSKRLGIARANEMRGELLTKGEEKILELYKSIPQNNETTNEDKLNKLLELVFDDENKREPYKERYEKSSFCLEDELRKMIAKKEYDYSKYGEEVTYEELKEVKKRMTEKNKDMEKNIEVQEVIYMKDELELLESWNEQNNRGIWKNVIKKIKEKLRGTKPIKKQELER